MFEGIPTYPDAVSLLNNERYTKLKIYVGCPIWNHPDWVGKIYPAKAKEKDFLTYYAQQYNSIELNATGYNIPTLSSIAKWVSSVPDNFMFCPKVTRIISHSKDIFDKKEAFDIFIDHVLHFEKNLGCTFFQFPPYFKPDKLNSLIKLLDTLPDNFELSVELRHEEWFNHAIALDELSSYLKSKKIGLVITDVSDRRDVLHQRFSNRTAFIRFTANDLHPSDFSRLDIWTTKTAEWIEHGLEKLYFFVHTPEKSLTPELAYYFIQELNKKAGTNIKPPKPLIDRTQRDLFE
ncbi:unnamed protein product [Rotaria sp. Silwood2]|nr:unnamed protein product [Rotaria sp. Silwood2]CAF4680584.1 unnamed protein product [Rotaria sp. Silwood2]